MAVFISVARGCQQKHCCKQDHWADVTTFSTSRQHRKLTNTEQKFIFLISTLNSHGINERCSFSSFTFSRHQESCSFRINIHLAAITWSYKNEKAKSQVGIPYFSIKLRAHTVKFEINAPGIYSRYRRLFEYFSSIYFYHSN